MLVLGMEGNNLCKALNTIWFFVKEQVKDFHAVFNIPPWATKGQTERGRNHLRDQE